MLYGVRYILETFLLRQWTAEDVEKSDAFYRCAVSWALQCGSIGALLVAPASLESLASMLKHIVEPIQDAHGAHAHHIPLPP